MADFTSVIRRAVEGLPDNKPELRARVYEKARSAVVRQMENMNPKPPEALIKRQIDKIDTAIAEVEAEFAEALPSDEPDELLDDHRQQDAAFEPSEDAPEDYEVEKPQPQAFDDTRDAAFPPEASGGDYEEARRAVYAEPAHSEEPRDSDPATEDDDDDDDGADISDRSDLLSTYGELRNAHFEVVPSRVVEEHAPQTDAPEPNSAYDFEEAEEADEPVSRVRVSEPDRFEYTDDKDEFEVDDGLLPQGNQGRWDGGITPAPPPPRRPVPEKDWAHVDSLLGIEPDDQPGSLDDYDGEDEDDADDRKTGRARSKSRLIPALIGLVAIVVLAGGGYFAWTNIGALKSLISGPAGDTADQVAQTQNSEDSGANVAASAGGDVATAEKSYSQRLLPDGKEVEEGLPAADASSGPARTVASQTSGSASPAPASQDTAAPSPPVGAGQKMYLYEEQLGQSVPSSYQGTVEWALKQQNNGTAVSEPVIEGTMSVPDVGLTGTITLRRNDDSSLPASHLIDVSFKLSDKFDGGAIDGVQRISMKTTEAARGDALIAVSAKITDNLYMLALNDFDQARAQNLTLLRDRNWIDIPVTYRNGRRALLTLEKGTTGMAIFDRAIQEWQALGDIGDKQ